MGCSYALFQQLHNLLFYISGMHTRSNRVSSTSPLGMELHAILEPVQYETTTLPQVEPLAAVPTYIQEGVPPVPQGAWFTDGYSLGSPSHWAAVTIQLKTDTNWFETGEHQSSNWTKLHAVWLVHMHVPWPIIICTKSWAVFQGLTL